MSQPGFELQWKTTLESPVRHGVSLGAGVITSGVNIFTPLSMIGAPSNQVFAVDNDTGNLFWTRRFEGTLAAGTAACPGGISGHVDADGEPHDSASRSREGRRARTRVLQQRGRRAWCRRTASRPAAAAAELPRRRRRHLRPQLQLQRPRQPLRRQRQRSRQGNGVRHRSRRMRPHRDREGDCFVRPALSMR